MYANPIWSLLLLAGVMALYWFVIRPRLKVRFADTYSHIDGFWARQFARLHAFRSYVATLVAAVLLAAPDIAVAVAGVDLSGILGHSWAQIVTSLLAIYLAVNRAFSTRPGEDK